LLKPSKKIKILITIFDIFFALNNILHDFDKNDINDLNLINYLFLLQKKYLKLFFNKKKIFTSKMHLGNMHTLGNFFFKIIK
jgi:hypothetical protein